MTNEEFQGLVLEQLAGLKTDISDLKTDVSALKTDVSALKTDVSALKTDVSALKTDVSALKTDVSALKTDVSALKTDVSALKTDVSSLREQTSENSQFIQALLHRTEELDAKLDGLAVNTASKESIADLDAKFDVLNKRLFQQEADLQRLKKAQ